MKGISWIERRWTFDLPAPMFPFLIERLRGTPARLEDRVRGLDDELLKRRGENTWSIQENAGHLLEVEALWHGRLDDFRDGATALRPADMENRRTVAADHNNRVLGTILAAFRASRMDLVRRLEELPDSEIEHAAHHPRLNRPMRIIDMAFFAAEHDDHHLARITELMAAGSGSSGTRERR